MIFLIAIIAATAITAINCESNIQYNEEAVLFLQKYGYLNNNNTLTSSNDMATSLRDAISLFQEYYRLPGDGEINDITLQQMRKPRCGLPDIPHHTFNAITRKWPKTHLTWNFHLADKNTLKTAEASFALWAANSSLTFERKSLNPDILISYRKGIHTNMKNGQVCGSGFDGPGGTLAHANFPSGLPNDVAEVHVDSTEPWHIHLNENPAGTSGLQQTLTHEIGHTLGLPHNPNTHAMMFAFEPEKTFPVKLHIEDILAIQHLYGIKDNLPISTPATTTEVTTNKPEHVNLCDLQYVDNVLVLEHRIFVTHRQHAWSFGMKNKTYDKPLLIRDYMSFIPANFTRLTAAYQRPSGNIVLFIDNMTYMVEYPGFKLISGWPKTLKDLRLPSKAEINAAINTNRGRTFLIFNGDSVAEINECTMQVENYYTLQAIFPGIPPAVTSAFRYTDGKLYFMSKRQFYKFDEFTRIVTAAGKFDLGVIDIECPKNGLLQQLQDLLTRLIRSNTMFEKR